MNSHWTAWTSPTKRTACACYSAHTSDSRPAHNTNRMLITIANAVFTLHPGMTQHVHFSFVSSICSLFLSACISSALSIRVQLPSSQIPKEPQRKQRKTNWKCYLIEFAMTGYKQMSAVLLISVHLPQLVFVRCEVGTADWMLMPTELYCVVDAMYTESQEFATKENKYLHSKPSKNFGSLAASSAAVLFLLVSIAFDGLTKRTLELLHSSRWVIISADKMCQKIQWKSIFTNHWPQQLQSSDVRLKFLTAKLAPESAVRTMWSLTPRDAVYCIVLAAKLGSNRFSFFSICERVLSSFQKLQWIAFKLIRS